MKPVKSGWTRASLKGYLAKRYDTRFHMSLILASTCLVGMITSWSLLHAGVHDMRVRYPLVLVVAYLAFLCGVWIWLRLAGFSSGGTKSKSSLADGSNLLDLPSGTGGGSGGGGLKIGGGLGRGGGTFDGGGASSAWAGDARTPMLAMNSQSPAMAEVAAGDGAAGHDGGLLGKAAGGLSGIDSDGLVLLLLGLLLALVVFASSGYLIWTAPDILTEAAFGAMLAGGLARPARNESAAGWIAGVVKKTWWPFALVLVVALAFASYSASHYPQAKTFREAVTLTIQGQ